MNINANFSLHKFSSARRDQPISPSLVCLFRLESHWLTPSDSVQVDFCYRKSFPSLCWALISWVWSLFEAISSEIKSFDYMTARWISSESNTFLSGLNPFLPKKCLFVKEEKNIPARLSLLTLTQKRSCSRPVPPHVHLTLQIPLGWPSINYPLPL